MKNLIPRITLGVSLMSALAVPCASTLQAQDSYWHQRVTMFDKLPVIEQDIVFLGNSITDGGEFAEIFGMENCLNRGIRSDVIGGVRKRLDQVVSGHPKKIFLLIGINDISHGKSAPRIAADYETLVEEIRSKSPGTVLYVQSVMPVNNDFKRYRNLIGRENVIPELNALLRDIAARHGAYYIDLWPALTDSSGTRLDRRFTNDGLHLLGAGYKAWADLIRPYVVNDDITAPEPEPETSLPIKKHIE